MLYRCCEDFGYFQETGGRVQNRVGRPMFVYLLYGSGGGGHKASADALQDALLERHPEWDVRTVNISPALGVETGDRLYNLCMERSWSLLIPVIHSTARLFSPLAEPVLKRKMAEMFQALPPADVVVSLVPFINPLLLDSQPGATHFTVLTDFTHTEGHPWLQDVRQKVICGTEESYQQAIDMGFPKENVTKTSGMIVNPRFYNQYDPNEMQKILMQLDFRISETTALVTFGAVPPTQSTRRLVIALLRKGYNVIVLCGKNTALLDTLCKLKLKYPELCLYLKNFTKGVSTYMQLADVVIGKPGPGIVSEALVSGRPLILYTDGGRVMDQERSVMEWVENNKLGVCASTPEEAASVSAEQIAKMRRHVDDLEENQSVFEVAKLVDEAVQEKKRIELEADAKAVNRTEGQSNLLSAEV